MDFPKSTAPALPGPRRVFTAPISNYRPNSPSQSTEGLVETLYIHPLVKIVSFTAGSRSVSLDPRYSLSAPDDAPGSLPWLSQIERTIAVGSMTIYRAPGSVAFLSCGSALQPILPKSQCWCVDESSSKFVLQIRRPQYWRIEIPEDPKRTQHLREVFGAILQFEKTACPFKRSFIVDLPEQPAPVRKRPWTPKVTKPEDTSRVHRKDAGLLHTAKYDDAPRHRCEVSLNRQPSLPAKNGGHQAQRKREDGLEKAADETSSSESREVDAELLRGLGLRINSQRLGHCSSFSVNRSFSGPPQLSVITSSPAKNTSRPSSQPDSTSESQSPTESHDSFHSVQSWHSPLTPLPPSPPLSDFASPCTFPYPHNNIIISRKAVTQETSEPTITPDIPQTWIASPTGATAPSSTTAASSNEEGEVVIMATGAAQNDNLRDRFGASGADLPVSLTASTKTADRPLMRHRAITSSSISHNHQVLSPLPPATKLFATRQRHKSISTTSTFAAVRQLPIAVISKTCEILLSPPSHLVNLMLKVAARITAGEWRGLVLGTSSSGEQIPVAWDWSDEVEGSDGGSWHAGLTPTPETRSQEFGSKMGRQKMAGSYPSDDEDDPEPTGSHEPTGETAVAAVAIEEEALDDAEWARSWGVD